MELRFEDFSTLVGHAVPMPAARVVFEDQHDLPLLGLLDTGSLHNLASYEIAEILGIDAAGLPHEAYAMGGAAHPIAFAPLRLTIGPHTWEAVVGFTDTFPASEHVLLGLEGFFRHFLVTLDVEREVTIIEPRSGPT